MMLRRVVLCVLGLFGAAACDLVVGPGQEIVLGNRGQVLASATPNAVSVLPGGSVVVQDADVFGLGVIGTSQPPLQLGQIFTGAAIVSDGGRVRIVQGRITGGNVLLLAPPQATPTDFGSLAPALVATGGSTVEIAGGMLTTSGVFLANGVAPQNVKFDFPRTVSVSDSDLRILGGTLRVGVRQDASAVPGADLLGAFPLDAIRSRVEISGGDFGNGFVLLQGSRSRILGGQIDRLFLAPALPETISSPGQRIVGCTEIRGGSFKVVTVMGAGERLIVFGSFNVPAGPIPGPAQGTSFSALSGTLEAGTPASFQLEVGAGTAVSLAAPGSAGCPSAAPFGP